MAGKPADSDEQMTAEYSAIARFEQVSHHYGDTRALDEITLDIPAGCMAGLIGPDGVGKSTLLGLVAGATKIQSGTISVLGGDIGDSGFRRSVSPRIAYMPQGLGKNLYLTLTVHENVDFFGRLFGLPANKRRTQIEEVLESTGLLPFSNRPAGKLSGGMKQKLGLCCSLIHEPDLLILDEPTTGVDPLSRQQFWELIARIRNRKAISVIVATAYMQEAERFDWLAAMDSGHILSQGTPGELRKRAGKDNLEDAFIELLPTEKRGDHSSLVIPPYTREQKTTAIEADGLTKRFGDFTAVDHVSFSIGQGEIFGFLGSNGCGKTTTMKMLTGLLPSSEGSATLFGRRIDAFDLATRKRVGYMSQSFSLYGELTVEQNLTMHARLFHLPEERIASRVDELTERFSLKPYKTKLATDLPMGIRQRLSLAVAVVHDPELLILDEPTSGVDPLARDRFWEILVDLSRNQGVTIFISTHFMNEGERCDRISLMHAGKVLAIGAPDELVRSSKAANLEDAFIGYLRQAAGEEHTDGISATPSEKPSVSPQAETKNIIFSPRRMYGYMYRESLEIIRDPVRLAFALLGSVILMLILGYGITFDIKDTPFAVLDRDNSPESRDYIASMGSSVYFTEHPPLVSADDIERRLQNGELQAVFEIPPDFGKDLKRGRNTEIMALIDGSMPFHGETIRGYIYGLHSHYLSDLAVRTYGDKPTFAPVSLKVRYRYNQDFESLTAMVPAVIPLLLIFIPAILMALGVVREKELGSITNLYVTPVTRLEFLLGKQIPYIAIGMISFFTLVVLSVTVFDVPVRGSFATLTFSALLYVIVTTGFGLLMSSFTRTQLAALAVTAFATLIPAVRFCGLTDPVSSLDGASAFLGNIYPTTYFLYISRGCFTKELGMGDLYGYIAALCAFIPVFTGLSLILLKKQGE